MKRYFTTPLYYVNAHPHLGHAYSTILADVLKRHYRQRGDEVVFLTGTDEHGEKIVQMAEKQGKTARALVDEISGAFRKVWDDLGLEYDIFYRTTEKSHIEAVQAGLARLKEKGEIEFREYEGLYCVGCERFLTEKELNPEGKCPDHLVVPERRKEGNYFFLMSKYQKKLIDHFEKNPRAIRPENYRNEMLSFLKQPLGDLCISRPKTRLEWGIEIPFDRNYVTYVWVDALTNYLAATGWPGDKMDREMWAGAAHLIGKDILQTHAIYWTALLMAWDVQPLPELHVSGWWLVGGTKMSKSLGNVIRPLEVEAQYGRETLRFHLLREMSYGLDATFTLETFVAATNAHLANGIGNLASRVLTLCQKNFKGTFDPASMNDADRAVLDRRTATFVAWNEGFEELKYQNALKAWSELVTAADLYVNDNKPWALAKDPAQAERLGVVLGVCLNLLEALAVIVAPVLPEASAKLLAALGVPGSVIPSLDSVRNLRSEYRLGSDVPKLFARVALPVLD